MKLPDYRSASIKPIRPPEIEGEVGHWTATWQLEIVRLLTPENLCSAEAEVLSATEIEVRLTAGEHLKTPDGTIAIADGGSTPKVHYGWMWDLTVQGDHDFYALPVGAGSRSVYHVAPGEVPVLVHNCGSGTITDEVTNEHVLPRHSLELDNEYPEFSDKSKFAEGVMPTQIRQWAEDATVSVRAGSS